MDIRRFFQVSHFAWIHSKDISKEEGKGFGFRLRIFIDMIYCFLKYRMWTNQYVKESFWSKNKEERELLGARFKEEGIIRDEWQKDFRKNRCFYIKYGNVKYEKAHLREKRRKAYMERYQTGKSLFVEYNVCISRQHYANGTISIGENVLLARDCDIDYTGDLIIGDSVGILEGVKILTHSHDYLGLKKEKDLLHDSKRTFLTPLEIAENVTIGTRSIIMPGVHYIGKNSIISAGSIVTKRIPDNVVVAGNPAKIVGSLEGLNIYKRTNY